MTAPIYRVDGLQKAYDGRLVLDVEHLEIQQGETFAIVGPSGAGKSTLLRLFNFLEPPTKGEIRFLERPFSREVGMPLELRRRVTTVFQQPMLLNRSVYANVAYGLRVRGMGDTDQRIRDVLRQVGLSRLIKQRARTLSGGEAQRVALARAMVLEPDVLLLDEPTANLDPHNVVTIERIIKDLNQDQKTTMIIVTHNVFQARRVADRVALMLDGKLVEVADVDAFFESPQDHRTRAFARGEMIY